MTAGEPGAARRWRQRLRRSLGARLVLLFLLLALATTGIFVAGMQRALSAGWSGLVRPLVADYVDRLAAEIGSPPDLARAQALVSRLPISVRIDGPLLQWDSTPQRRAWHRGDGRDDGDWLLTRSSADGHRITFGLGNAGWAARPRNIGWITLGGLLLLTAVAYGVVRHLFRPLDDIRAGALRFGQGRFEPPIPVRRRDELGELAGADQHHGARPARHARSPARPAAGGEPRAALAADPRAAERRTRGTGRGARRAAARPGRDARPDQRPAGKRAPGRRPCRAAARAGRSERAGARRGR